MFLLAVVLAWVSVAIGNNNGTAVCSPSSNNIYCSVSESGGDIRVGAEIDVVPAPTHHQMR